MTIAPASTGDIILSTDADTTLQLSGTTNCDHLQTDSSGNVGCGTPDMVYMSDAVNTTWADSDTTELWNGATQPNITPKSTASSILVMVTMRVSIDAGNSEVNPVARIDREVGATASCATVDTVGGTIGGTRSDNNGADPAAILTYTSVFVDAPATVSNVSYTVCTSADSSTTLGTSTETRIDFTLFEINDAADLAEVYPTNDATLGPGEVVTLDPKLPGGVKRSDAGYDRRTIGIVSTKPAQVIGGTEGLGVTGMPIALAGRVPVKVTTHGGDDPIEVGDYLTTSEIPGVAMKATKPGVVIGKALTGLKEGDGMVVTFIEQGFIGMDQEVDTAVLDALGEGAVTMTERGVEVKADVLTVKDDNLAGSVATDASGLASVEFTHHLGTVKPVVQLTVEGDTFAFAQVKEFFQDAEGNYTGFLIKTFAPTGTPFPQVKVHYLVVAKPEHGTP